MSARDRILGRVRGTLLKRAATPHPGDFDGWRPAAPRGSAVDAFQALFEAAGGEVVRVADAAAAAEWLAGFATAFASAVTGERVPPGLRPRLEAAPADAAELGVSMARAAVAETGSLVLDARDGRRAQLLAPVHVVFVNAETVWPSLRETLVELAEDLPSAIGLHSGPSKSADIGQIMVKGVHGPGRVVAVVVGEGR